MSLSAPPGRTQPNSLQILDELAKITGLSRQTIHRVKYIVENGDEEVRGNLRTGSVSINEAFKETRSIVNRSNREEAEKNGRKEFQKTKIPDHQDVHLGDFRKVSKQLKDNSVDLIFTDPEYALEKVHLYGDLAEIEARVLKPGGALMCYTGNKFLPEIMELMTPHLKFYWTLACIHSGNAAQEQHHRNIGIIGTRKSLLLFVKEKRGDRTVFIRDSIVGDYDKQYHPYGQGESEAQYFIEKRTMLGQKVVDFCSGGGATLVVAKRLKRKWWGCDIDKEAVKISRQRLAEVDIYAPLDERPTVTAHVGNNAVLFREVAQMYLNKWYFKRLIAKGAINMVDGKCYLVEAAAQQYLKERRKRALLFLGITLLLIGLYCPLQDAFR